MPLYLVRWPWLKASLVSARDESDLLDTLDQVDDSEGATWKVYRGPVWIDFDVPAEYRIEEKYPGEPLRLDELVIDDVAKVEIGTFEHTTPGCDHTFEMHEAVTKQAFPALHACLYDYKSDTEPSDAEVRRAVLKELKCLVNAEWRKSNRSRRSDSLGVLAQQLGAPVAQIENVLRSTGQLPPSAPKARRAKVRKLKRTKRGKGKSVDP